MGFQGEVPVVDLAFFSKVRSFDDSQRAGELRKLKKACQEWGFFKIVNHDLDPHSFEKIRNSTKEFFNLPLEEKVTLATPRFPFGFVHESKTAGTKDGREHVLFYGLKHPSAELNAWPAKPDNFKDNVDDYRHRAADFSQFLINIVFEALGIPNKAKETFEKKAGDQFLLAYYPAAKSDDTREHVLGPHVDTGFMAVLAELNSVSGLEVFKDEKWIPVEFKEGELAVIFGNVLQVWTNKMYKSVLHRVAKCQHDRYTVVYNIIPSWDAEIATFPEFVTDDRQPLYTPFIQGDYMRSRHANDKHK